MIGIGLLGAGFIGSTLAEAISHVQGGRLIAVADSNQNSADRLASRYQARAYYSMEALLDDPDIDVVDICLPTYLHEKSVVAAAGHGKHVFCEKPVALSLLEVDRMISAVSAAGVKAMIGQVVRFWPEYRKIAELLKNGSFGEPLIANASRRTEPGTWGDWLRDPALSGGALFDLHIHDVDYIYSLFGKPQQVYSVGEKSPNGAWNHVITTMVYADKKATAEASYLMPKGYPFQASFRLHCTGGSLEYAYRSGQIDEQAQAGTNLIAYRPGLPQENPEIDQRNAFEAEIEYFLDCVREDRQPETGTLAQAREVLSIIQAAQKSLESGDVIAL